MKNIIFGTTISILFLLSGCNDHNNSIYKKAVQFCVENNGTVIRSAKNDETQCRYMSVYHYDDGEHIYTATCEIETFHNDPEACHNLYEEGISTILPLTSSTDSTPIKLREAFYTQIKQILEHMDHTGYTHKYHGPFVLHPSYNELTQTNSNGYIELNLNIDSFNLFLDCSGFVGYYIVQGIAGHLYHELNTCYHSSRPLAADFADAFKTAKHKTTDHNVRDALLSDLDINASTVVWGMVPHIKDALPGDIIVYKHTKNIVHHGECNNTITGNTGHVLFVMHKPQISNKYDNEWLVRVADSTTSPHSTDSRYSNNAKGTIKHGSEIYNKSSYNDNKYTAWTKRYKKGDWLELCDTDDNNTFHRRCSNYNETSSLKIDLQTRHIDSSTGIGIGYIYISDDMKHYRVKKGTDTEEAEIYIGRPIVKTVP